jgi:hypothetical protein
MSPLSICRAADIPRDCVLTTPAWLVESLWAERAVGIVGGEPKCGKSFLALDLAVAVASGTPCLRRFAVPRPGRVLLFAAEDSLAVVHARLQGIAQAAGTDLAALDLYLITTPVLRLDLGIDRERLHQTVAALTPRLLILDPFVRLHRIDENAVAEVAPLLAYLRELERTFACAVVLVHHVRKGAAHLRAGQALRGSSELHAWGDSNLYLRRRGTVLRLGVEHRAFPAIDDLALELRTDAAGSTALHYVDSDPAESIAAAAAPAERVEHALRQAAHPFSLAELRAACRMRTATLCDTLTELIAAGRVRKTAEGYVLTAVSRFPPL